MTTRTNLALLDHAEKTQTDARAVESHINRLLAWPHWPLTVEDISANHINRWITHMQKGDKGAQLLGEAAPILSASTIGTRLSVLKKAMQRAGVAWPVDVKMPQRSKRPKWVLPLEQQDTLVADLLGKLCVTDAEEFVALPMETRNLMADYILFVTETGLRVEEVLRIRSHNVLVIEGNATLEVMGTKTASSYDLIPLSSKAMEILVRRILKYERSAPLFPIRYETLHEVWQLCRSYLRVTDETATLKSLRRTFASRLAAKGIPTTLLQKLMRHASLVTTSHYTNAIGLHEAAREWLS